ncbi:serine hydrolase domain-containing protein [Desulfobacterota bacterium M19]
MENLNIFTRIYEDLEPLFEEACKERIFPGAVASITIEDQEKKYSFFLASGSLSYKKKEIMNLNVFFDLASLTKPLATVPAVLSLLNKKIISLDDCLTDLLNRQVPADKNKITLRQLLNHSSGLPAYRPYYQDLKNNQEKQSIIDKILCEELVYPPGTEQIYSDLGFMIIGEIVTERTGLNFEKYVSKTIYQPLFLDNLLFFHNKDKNIIYAPTEQCPWGHKMLKGKVHDDNARFFGVSGHAGLFGNIYGVTGLINYFVDIINGKIKPPFIDRNCLKQFIKKDGDRGSFALGFDTPSPGKSSSGKYFSSNSFGHLGFTGTSFWVDLTKGVSIVLLSNRVYPRRDNDKIRKFRPLFHDTIMNIINVSDP